MNIKRLLYSFILFLIITGGISAQGEIPTGSILWKISGNGLKKSSYIIGTHHIITKDILNDLKGINEALSNTEQVVGEIDMNEIAHQSNLMQNAALMPDSITYNQLLSEQDYATLDTNLKAIFNVGLDKLSKLNPVTINTLYVVNVYNTATGNVTQSEPMDLYFQRIAGENNKTVIGLEEIKDQIQALYYSSSIERQVQDLLCETSNKEYTLQALSKLDDYYKKGDLKSMFEMTNDENNPCPNTSEEKDQIYKNRNDKWLLKLPSIMADKPSFIAVGCLHIAGEDGLLWQLKQMGYTVEAVK